MSHAVKYYTLQELAMLMGLVKDYLLSNLHLKHTYKSIALHFITTYPSINVYFLRLHTEDYLKMSIAAFIKKERLIKAKELVLDNTLTVKLISQKLGMTPATLSSDFKKEFQESIRQYKKRRFAN